MADITAIYHMADLTPELVPVKYMGVDDRFVTVTYLGLAYRCDTRRLERLYEVHVGCGGMPTWRLGVGDWWGVEPTLTRLRAALRSSPMFASCRKEDPAPKLIAESLDRQIRRRLPLSASECLADPDFARLARKAAEAGRTYVSEMLAWERKSVVQEAVAIVRKDVDAERAVERARLAKIATERAVRLAAEKPTRDAVLEAYWSCDFRTCRQGYEASVVIGECPGVRPGVRCDTVKAGRYSSSCTYSKQVSIHAVTVASDWLEAVEAKGLATIDGKLCLDAQPSGHTPDGQVVLTLTLIRQGRGTRLETETLQMVEDGAGHRRPLATREQVCQYAHPAILHDVLIDLDREDAARLVRV